jgi:hypothetical protein
MIEMASVMQRRNNVPLNVLTATGGLVLLTTCLVAIDQRVRDQVAHILTGKGPTGDLGGAVSQIQQTVEIALQALRDQSLAYAPLTIFGLAALVLVLFMTRT